MRKGLSWEFSVMCELCVPDGSLETLHKVYQEIPWLEKKDVHNILVLWTVIRNIKVITIYPFQDGYSRIILCAHPANERRRYIVTSSLIGWAHFQDDPWILVIILTVKFGMSLMVWAKMSQNNWVLFLEKQTMYCHDNRVCVVQHMSSSDTPFYWDHFVYAPSQRETALQ